MSIRDDLLTAHSSYINSLDGAQLDKAVKKAIEDLRQAEAADEQPAAPVAEEKPKKSRKSKKTEESDVQEE